MFVLHADKNRLTVCQRESITSGSVNVYTVRFEFSPDWEGMDRTAVFQGGGETRYVPLDGTDECTVPHEVLRKPLNALEAGVYGTRDSGTVLPTIWANLGTILPGVATEKQAAPDSPDQALASKGDGLAYDGLNLSLMSGDRPLSTVQIPGGGEGSVSNHCALSHRAAADQHPIKAISQLDQELAKRITEDDALSVIDIIRIMEG